MREKRGRLGRTVGAVADSIASATRRRRGTRVVVYDGAGHGTLLRPEAPEHKRLEDLAGQLIALAGGPPDSAPEADSDPSE